MKLRAWILYPALAILMIACERHPAMQEDAVPWLAIENVTVIPMDVERVQPGQTVLIQGDRIVEIGALGEVEVPGHAERVDGSGKYLLPGLAEMHAHLPLEDAPESLTDLVLTLFLSQGVTFARGMQGAPGHPQLRDAIAAGDRTGPRLQVAGPAMRGADLTDAETARERVRSQAEAGFDLIKIHEGLSPEVFGAIVATADEHGLPFAGHVPDQVGLFRMLEAGPATIDHLDNYLEALRPDHVAMPETPIFGVIELLPELERDRIADVVAATRTHQVAMVPTMALWSRFLEDAPADTYRDAFPELAWLPDAMLADWDEMFERLRERIPAEAGSELQALRHEVLRALHSGGVYLLLGSDAPQGFNVPGYSIHREMAYLQETVGLPPYEILFSGTRAVAEHLGTPEAFGTVLPERRADLLLVRANPLEDVRHAADVAGVVRAGRWYPESWFQQRLEALSSQAAAAY